MSANSKISWTHHTFNPWWGCTKVHIGDTPSACDFCYAESWDKRTGGKNWGSIAPRRFFGDKHWSEPHKWNVAALRAGVRERVFCASMCDIFEDYHGPNEADVQITRLLLWEMIEQCPGLDWLLLTKRPQNVYEMVPCRWLKFWPDHVWMGCTAEHQPALNERWPHMQMIPARVKFISYESALGPITVPPDCNWFIAGGESGAKARPSHPDWFRSARDQCAALVIPFHFKQWGEWEPCDQWPEPEEGSFYIINGKECCVDYAGVAHETPGDYTCPPGWKQMVRVGKKAAGRLLDGVEHNGFPQ